MTGAMRPSRRGRPILGAIGGAIWGAGAAVLIQQFGLWPLDRDLAFGAPVGAALVSALWGRLGGRRVVTGAAMMIVALGPAIPIALQSATCDVQLTTTSDSQSLANTAPASPFVVDPAVDQAVTVEIPADSGGTTGEVWVEFAGISLLQWPGTVNGALSESIDLANNGRIDFTRLPGVYHIGGTIDGVCSGEGYVRITGNPLAGPVGLGASGAVVLGLALTLLAGRPARIVMPPTARSGALRPGGEPLRLIDATIHSPGLSGNAAVLPGANYVLRDVAGWTDEVREVLDLHSMETRHVIELTETAEHPKVGDQNKVTTHLGEPAVAVDLPHPGPGNAQVVLSTDEGGVAMWHFARTAGGAIDVDGATQRFLIPRFVAPSDEPRRMPELFRSFGSKVLTRLVFPVTDPVFGHLGKRFASRWEAARRPNRFRSFTPDDFDQPEAAEPDWNRLAGGKALLLVHGTFSRAHTGFGGFSRDFVADLDRLYDGRVFAFDHFTLSVDPLENVQWFFANLPKHISLDVDIVCHSRGGLVSRVLAEKQGEVESAGRSVRVDKIVFAGTPNAGTILTEPAYIGDFIDSYTNMMNFASGVRAVDAFEALVAVVKQIAVGAVGGLPGLQAMRPTGLFLQWLNAPATDRRRYFAVAGNFEPAEPGWRHHAADRLMDRIFVEPNDLVVPTTGTFGDNGSSHFPITDRLVLDETHGVNHSGYFADKEVRDRLIDWLTG